MRNWYQKPLPAALLLVLLWTGVRMAALRQTGIAPPRIHDEFSYLLAGDTFAQGRLANPPHPMAKFFESPHILVRPTYSSKYPPGQGLFLALGQRVFGDPFYGVLIGNALMLFSFSLMLYAWAPPVWALAVSGMFALCLRPGMYWTDSYWGGSLAAAGGALVLLGIGMYRKHPGIGAGVAFGLGSALLFWTRPLEGGVFTLLVLMVFAGEIWRKRRAAPFAAGLAVFAAAAAWTFTYNKAVTGDPFLIPYVLHDRTYNVVRVFWFLPERAEPAYSHPRLAGSHGKHGFDMNRYWHPDLTAWQRYARGLIEALRSIWAPLGAALLLFLILPLAWREPDYRKLGLVVLAFPVLFSFVPFHMQHYAAPYWAALAVLAAIAAQRAWRYRAGRIPAGAALVALALTSPVHGDLADGRLPGRGLGNLPAGECAVQRARLIEKLSRLERRQLVLIRYPWPDWEVHCEWVYNGADIDSQHIIFAHDLGEEENRTLLAHYPEREVVRMKIGSAKAGK